jgi:hypothetical protein
MLLDENNQCLQQIIAEDNLSHHDKFNFTTLLKDNKVARKFQITFYDPNT